MSEKEKIEEITQVEKDTSFNAFIKNKARKKQAYNTYIKGDAAEEKVGTVDNQDRSDEKEIHEPGKAEEKIEIYEPDRIEDEPAEVYAQDIVGEDRQEIDDQELVLEKIEEVYQGDVIVEEEASTNHQIVIREEDTQSTYEEMKSEETGSYQERAEGYQQSKDTSFQNYKQANKVKKQKNSLTDLIILLIKIGVGLMLLPFIAMVGGTLLGVIGMVLLGILALIVGGFALLVGGAFFASSFGGGIIALMFSIGVACMSLGILILLILFWAVKVCVNNIKRCQQYRKDKKRVNERGAL